MKDTFPDGFRGTLSIKYKIDFWNNPITVSVLVWNQVVLNQSQQLGYLSSKLMLSWDCPFKRAVLNAEIQRDIRVSSDQRTREHSLKTITELFLKNGYPIDIIKRTIKNNKHKVAENSRKSKNNVRQNNKQLYMRLPYINETVVRRVSGILRGSKIPVKPVWINEKSIQKRQKRPKVNILWLFTQTSRTLK